MSFEKSLTSLRTASLAIAMILVFASAAYATSARTFVSGLGNDANMSSNCPVTNPCRTLATAYGITTAGGEVIVLDSAGYGTLTITNSISIIALQPASISVAASGTGVTVNAGSGHLVLLKGLEINGANTSNSTGITVNSGRVILKNSTLKFLSSPAVPCLTIRRGFSWPAPVRGKSRRISIPRARARPRSRPTSPQWDAGQRQRNRLPVQLDGRLQHERRLQFPLIVSPIGRRGATSPSDRKSLAGVIPSRSFRLCPSSG